MDVAEGASPLAAPTAVETEALLAVSAPPAIEASAPVDAPPIAATLDADAAAPASPSRFRRVVAAPFWAGLLGGGAALWVCGLVAALSRAYLLDRPTPESLFLVALTIGLGVAIARGYRTPLRSYASLAGRLVGALFYASIALFITVSILVTILDGVRATREVDYLILTLAGAVVAGLALARIHGIGAEKPRRIKIAAGAAVVLLLSLWPSSPSLRCRLGFGEGCRAAAYDAGDRGDLVGAGSAGARGCDREDAIACRLAGRAYGSAGPARDLRRADGFFRDGCALGDPESCQRVHGIELERGCDRFGANACAELARAYARGDGVDQDPTLAQRYSRKACLLGSADACREGGDR